MSFFVAAAAVLIVFYLVPLHLLVYRASSVIPLVPGFVRVLDARLGINASYLWLMGSALAAAWLIVFIIFRFEESEAIPGASRWVWWRQLSSDRGMLLVRLAPLLIAMMLCVNAFAVIADALTTGQPARLMDFFGGEPLLVLMGLVSLMSVAVRWERPADEGRGLPPPPVIALEALPGVNGILLRWYAPLRGAAYGAVAVRRPDGEPPQSPDDGVVVAAPGEVVIAGDEAKARVGAPADHLESVYAVFALGDRGTHAAPRWVTAATLPSVPPLEDFAAEPQPGGVLLRWQMPLAGASVMIRRGLADMPPNAEGGVLVYEGYGAGVVDTALLPGTTGHYSAFVVSALGEYSAPRTASAKVLAPPGPTLLKATPEIGAIHLRWHNPDSPEVDRAVIFRRTRDGSVRQIAEVKGDAWTCDDPGDEPAEYLVTVRRRSGELSAPASTGLIVPRFVEPVRNVIATGHRNKIVLRWDNPADGLFQRVRVLRGREPEFPLSLGELRAEGTSTSYTDAPLLGGETYWYALVTVDRQGRMSRPVWVSASTHRPPTVSRLRAVSDGAAVALTWQNPALPEFERAIVVRGDGHFPANPSDGECIYDGAGRAAIDPEPLLGEMNYYSVFVRFAGEALSPPGQVAVLAEDVPEPGAPVAPSPSQQQTDPLTKSVSLQKDARPGEQDGR